jgi:hypothetical protein
MRGYLTNTQEQMAFRLKAHRWSLVDIGREIGCSASMMVRNGQFRMGLPDDWSPPKGCLSILEREHILLGVNRGESMRTIARSLGRAPSMTSRELAANGGRAVAARGVRSSTPAKLPVGPNCPSCAAGGCSVKSHAACSRCGRPRRSPSAYGWTIRTISPYA